ncbi:MAG: dihydroxyacetone kinase subunit DhaK, partial [Chloroflexi bacterium]|nr:dihydroxyacetone kinase subunit DhaK [Chloroflexota bacterium]
MPKPKKIINDPKQVVPEMLDGLIAAYHGKIRELAGVQALVKSSLPTGKVGVLIGGGSGHEPLFHGYLGQNMADGA